MRATPLGSVPLAKTFWAFFFNMTAHITAASLECLPGLESFRDSCFHGTVQIRLGHAVGRKVAMIVVLLKVFERIDRCFDLCS